MREIKIRARTFETRLSIVEVRIKSLNAYVGVRAVIGKYFAECVASLKIQSAAKATPNFHASGVVGRAGIVAQQVRSAHILVWCRTLERAEISGVGGGIMVGICQISH